MSSERSGKIGWKTSFFSLMRSILSSELETRKGEPMQETSSSLLLPEVPLKSLVQLLSMNTENILKRIEALERRFQQVMVDEPSQEDAIAILRGIAINMKHSTESKSPIVPLSQRSNSR